MQERRITFFTIVGVALIVVGIVAVAGFIYSRWFGPPNVEATATAVSLQATQKAMNHQATKVALSQLATDTALEVLAADIAATKAALEGESITPTPTSTSTPTASSKAVASPAPNAPVNIRMAEGLTWNGLQIEIIDLKLQRLALGRAPKFE